MHAKFKTKKEKRNWRRTILHLSIRPASTLRPSMTTSPATIALVVAIAGMMFPAIAVDTRT